MVALPPRGAMHDRSVQQVESGLVWIGEEELWRSGDRTGKQELEAGGAELGVECGAERSGGGQTLLLAM